MTLKLFILPICSMRAFFFVLKSTVSNENPPSFHLPVSQGSSKIQIPIDESCKSLSRVPPPCRSHCHEIGTGKPVQPSNGCRTQSQGRHDRYFHTSDAAMHSLIPKSGFSSVRHIYFCLIVIHFRSRQEDTSGWLLTDNASSWQGSPSDRGWRHLQKSLARYDGQENDYRYAKASLETILGAGRSLSPPQWLIEVLEVMRIVSNPSGTLN